MAPAAWLLLGVLARAWPHWQWSVLWTTLTPTGGGLRDQILGTLILMLGVFIIAGTIGVLAGIHLAELARPAAQRQGQRRRPADRVGHPRRASRRSCWATSGYTALVVGLHWGFSLPRRADHPVHHGHPLHRQDHGELAAPGPDRLPRGGRGPRDVDGLRPAQGGPQERAARHRHRAPPGAGHRLRRDGAAHLHGRVLQHAAALADPRPVPLPDLRRLHLLQRPLGAEPLPGLRRRADPRRHRPAPARVEPHHRGPHPAPRREAPGGTGRAAALAAPAPRPDRPADADAAPRRSAVGPAGDPPRVAGRRRRPDARRNSERRT